MWEGPWSFQTLQEMMSEGCAEHLLSKNAACTAPTSRRIKCHKMKVMNVKNIMETAAVQRQDPAEF